MCCVVGTVPAIHHYATGGYPATGNNEFIDLCVNLGGSWLDARELGFINDKFNGNPAERYQYMLKFLMSEVNSNA